MNRYKSGSRRRSGPPLQRLSGLTETLIAPAMRQRTQMLARLVAAWPQIGADCSKWCLPSDIHFSANSRMNATLVLSVCSGYGPQIQMLAPQLVERVNRLYGYGAVGRIRIKQDLLRPRPDSIPAQRMSSAPALPLARIEQATASVSNPELRAALIRLGRAIS